MSDNRHFLMRESGKKHIVYISIICSLFWLDSISELVHINHQIDTLYKKDDWFNVIKEL